MPLHDFKGPLTNDKTAVFVKLTGVTAASNLVKSVRDAADADAIWTAVKNWAGVDDANVTRLSAAITELPDFVAPPNRVNTEVYDGDGQSVQTLGIGTTPDLDLTLTMFDPGNNNDHAAMAAIEDGTLLDIAVFTATTWKDENTKHLDGSDLECGGFAALVLAGEPFVPGGAAGDFSRLTVPLAFRSRTQRIVASY